MPFLSDRHDSFSYLINIDSCLVLEEVLHGFVGNHLLVEDVGTRLGAAHHLDNLCISATIL